MKTKLILVALLSGVTILSARTPMFTFNQDVLTPTEYWDIWTENPTLGSATGDIYNWEENRDDQLNMNGGSYDVNVKISGDFVAGHPNSSVFVNAIFSNIKLEITSTSIFTKNIGFHFNNGTHVIYNATATTQTSGGDLKMTDGTSSLLFNSGAKFINTTSTSIGAAKGYQKVTIVGSNAEIQFRNFAFVGATTDKSNIVGGHLILKPMRMA